MKKEYRFPGEFARYINWNSIMPDMLNVWLEVQVTKDLESGEIVIRVNETEK